MTPRQSTCPRQVPSRADRRAALAISREVRQLTLAAIAVTLARARTVGATSAQLALAEALVEDLQAALWAAEAQLLGQPA